MEKRRFILFGWDTYYPCGGINDIVATFEEEEYEEMKSTWYGEYDYFQVFDTETFKTYDANKGDMPKSIK